MAIPLLDLKQQYAAIREEALRVTAEVYESQYFILGPRVDAFERDFAAYCQTRHAVGVSSGTDALLEALMVLGIGHGDEVIVPAYSFFATAGVVSRLGAVPVFVDIDLLDYNIDPTLIDEKITSRTKAIMPVHLYGQCAPMTEINAIAARRNIPVIEDAAQAVGSEYDGKRAGSLGTMGCFSFFPSKNLGAYGDAGMIVTSDEKMEQRTRRLRTHGGTKMYHHDEVGLNSRLDALQAAVLLAKLPYLAQWSQARRQNAAWYSQALAGIDGVKTPVTDASNEHIFHQYVIEADRRDELQAFLKEKGIGTAVYYPLPLHQQNCFAYLGYRKGSMPVAERAAGRVLALPCYPEMTAQQKEHVATSIRAFYGR